MKTSSVAPNAVIMLLLYYEWILQKSILGDGLSFSLSLSLSAMALLSHSALFWFGSITDFISKNRRKTETKLTLQGKKTVPS